MNKVTFCVLILVGTSSYIHAGLFGYVAQAIRYMYEEEVDVVQTEQRLIEAVRAFTVPVLSDGPGVAGRPRVHSDAYDSTEDKKFDNPEVCKTEKQRIQALFSFIEEKESKYRVCALNFLRDIDTIRHCVTPGARMLQNHQIRLLCIELLQNSSDETIVDIKKRVIKHIQN